MLTIETTETIVGEAAETVHTSLGPASGRALREANPVWAARMAEAALRFESSLNGDLRSQAWLQESMSTSDFPYIFGDYLSRQLAARYAEAPAIWPQFAARITVPDFRKSKIIDLLGGASYLPEVPELAPYKARGFTESMFEFQVSKKGAVLAWSWEMNVNDAIGAFQRAPAALSLAARQTEDRSATKLLIDADGSGVPSWMGAAGTAALTAANLQTAITTVTNKVDTDGNPLVSVGLILIVPPALELTARQILETVETRDPTTGRVIRGNGLTATPQLVVNPWLTVLNGSAKDVTTWYLLPAPDSIRPALYMAFLRGHEEPDLRYKNDQGTRPGGGAIAAVEGSFERDDIRYRIRTVHGASVGFTDVAYVSEGS